MIDFYLNDLTKWSMWLGFLHLTTIFFECWSLNWISWECKAIILLKFFDILLLNNLSPYLSSKIIGWLINDAWSLIWWVLPVCIFTLTREQPFKFLIFLNDEKDFFNFILSFLCIGILISWFFIKLPLRIVKYIFSTFKSLYD